MEYVNYMKRCHQEKIPIVKCKNRTCTVKTFESIIKLHEKQCLYKNSNSSNKRVKGKMFPTAENFETFFKNENTEMLYKYEKTTNILKMVVLCHKQSYRRFKITIYDENENTKLKKEKVKSKQFMELQLNPQIIKFEIKQLKRFSK